MSSGHQVVARPSAGPAYPDLAGTGEELHPEAEKAHKEVPIVPARWTIYELKVD